MFSLKYSNMLAFNGKHASVSPVVSGKSLAHVDPISLEKGLEWLEKNWPGDMPLVWFCHLGTSLEEVFGRYPYKKFPEAIFPSQAAELYGPVHIGLAVHHAVKIGFNSEIRHASSSGIEGYWLLVSKKSPLPERILGMQKEYARLLGGITTKAEVGGLSGDRIGLLLAIFELRVAALDLAFVLMERDVYEEHTALMKWIDDFWCVVMESTRAEHGSEDIK